MAGSMCRVTGIALCVGFLMSGLGPYAQASQEWIRGECPPKAPFSYCLVTQGAGTWTLLNTNWTVLGILVHPWLIEIRNPYTGRITGQVTALGPRRFTGLPAFSPDGRLLAASLDDGTVRVWDVESGRELWTLPSRAEGSSAAFGPDGRLLYSLGPDGEIVGWDMTTGAKVLSLREFEPVGGAAVIGLSPDGRWLVGGIPWWTQAGAVERRFVASVVWDVSTGLVARVFPGWVFFLPNGQLLVSDSRSPLPKMTVWDGVLGSKLQEVWLPWLQAVGGLSVRPDGQYIAFGLADGTIRFWEVSTAQEVAKLDLKAVFGGKSEVELFRLAEVSFSPEGDHLLTVVWAPSPEKLQVHLWHVGGLLKEKAPQAHR